MCETCGCGGDGERSTPVHDHSHNHDHSHGYDHNHEHPHRKTISLNKDILSDNNITAGMNRRFFEGRKVICLNMVSSPGSGKTAILEKTVAHFSGKKKLYVIEGDQQTSLDSERIERAGAFAVQINTGSGCHLDAKMVEGALARLNIEMNSVIFIENVGNLVCPAMYDLGESERVLVVSVTEGEDKPLKYPLMFETSHICVINKSDLLPYVDFHTEKFINNALSINHHLEFMIVSAKTGDGMERWYDWISQQGKSLLQHQ